MIQVRVLTRQRGEPVVRWCRWQHAWFSARRQEFEPPTDCHAPFGYGLVSRPFKAEERVRIPHGVPVEWEDAGWNPSASAIGKAEPWRSWCNGNTVVCDSANDGFESLRSPQRPCSATDSAPVSGTGGCRFESCQGHFRHQTPVAQRKEFQSTKLRMGVRFSPGVLRRSTESPWPNWRRQQT